MTEQTGDVLADTAKLFSPAFMTTVRAPDGYRLDGPGRAVCLTARGAVDAEDVLPLEAAVYLGMVHPLRRKPLVVPPPDLVATWQVAEDPQPSD